ALCGRVRPRLLDRSARRAGDQGRARSGDPELHAEDHDGLYADSFDPYPAIALNGTQQFDERGQEYWLFEVFDDTHVHYAYVRDVMLMSPGSLRIEYLESRPHGAPVTPVTYHTP